MKKLVLLFSMFLIVSQSAYAGEIEQNFEKCTIKIEEELKRNNRYRKLFLIGGALAYTLSSAAGPGGLRIANTILMPTTGFGLYVFLDEKGNLLESKIACTSKMVSKMRTKRI